MTAENEPLSLPLSVFIHSRSMAEMNIVQIWACLRGEIFSKSLCVP